MNRIVSLLMEDEGILAFVERQMGKKPERRFAFTQESAAHMEEDAIDA